MTGIAIVCGVLLILLGAAGYGYGLTSGHASLTALIPAAFGIVIAVFGYVGRLRESLRMHAMHVAVIFGLAGFIIPVYRLISNYTTVTMSAAAVSQMVMALICLVFVILSIKSFIDARRRPLTG
jgi:hypothetical protein